jgi:hypothetical protein
LKKTVSGGQAKEVGKRVFNRASREAKSGFKALPSTISSAMSIVAHFFKNTFMVHPSAKRICVSTAVSVFFLTLACPLAVEAGTLQRASTLRVTARLSHWPK